jgi:hypothetical protein
MKNVALIFNRRLFVATLERMVTDEIFSARRSSWVRALIKAIVTLRLHYLAVSVPVAMQPLIDCKLTRFAANAATD